MCEANGHAVGAMLAAVYDDGPPTFRWKRRRRRKSPPPPAGPAARTRPSSPTAVSEPSTTEAATVDLPV